MQKISRIYLGNCGYSMAWYDGNLFELTHPDTGEPDDTILNLENGGGKTSLLSLIFSCFETSQDRFLKHIQNKNNHFSQYFAQDGLPGFILMEWTMPPRILGGEPYRLVLGQVVSVKTGNDAPESDRIFFSFQERQGLSLKDVPAPKLGATPVLTMAEFSRWVHDQQRLHASDVFITRKQADWQAHMRNDRLIDLEMLQLQLGFSAQEGGMDTSFLTFNSEPEFLRKFFRYTLDPQRAVAVRDGVATTCDRLRRKPHYVRKLAELERFQGVLGAFDAAAADYRQARADQLLVLVAGVRLALGLQGRANDRRQGQAAEIAYELEQRQIAATAQARAVLLRNETATLQSLWHQLTVREALERKTSADAKHTGLVNSIRYVRAARLRAEIAAAEKRIEELEGLASLAREGLKPYQMHVETQGALLRAVLFLQESTCQERLLGLEREALARKGLIDKQKTAHAEAERSQRRAEQEQATLNAAENSFKHERARLIESGFLEDENESTEDATSRWQEQEQQLRLEKTSFESDQVHLDAEAKTWRDRAGREAAEAVRLDGEIKNLNGFIAEANAEHERLSQHPVILGAVESDAADPASPALPPLLERVVTGSAREVSLCDVRLAELSASRQAIEETGVAGNNADVAMVVTRLREAGVKSARPFNEYLADVLPDAEKARALVSSDPARFLGVSVAPSEMTKIAGLAWDPLPSRPVVVSPLAMDASPASGTSVVVPPGSDAAYNKDAAQRLLASLQERVASEQKRRSDYFERQTGAVAALEAVRSFLKKFGDGKRAAAQALLSQHQEDRATAAARDEEARGRAEQAAATSRERQKSAHERDIKAGEAASTVRALTQFRSQHELNRPTRLARREELEGVIADLDVAKETALVEAERLEEVTRIEYKVGVQLDSQAKELGRERAAIEFYDREQKVDAAGQDLEALRATYRDAVAAFKAKESDQLGVLEVSIRNARQQRQDKTLEFSREFDGVTKSAMAPYDGVDYVAVQSQLDGEKSLAFENMVSCDSNHRYLKSNSETWHKQQQAILPATPVMEAMDAPTLVLSMDGLKAEAANEEQRQVNSLTEADRAKSKARQLGEDAKKDVQIASLLKTSLGFDELPSPELLEIELSALTGEDAPPAEPLVLALDATEQVKQLGQGLNAVRKRCDKALQAAQTAFTKVQAAAGEEPLQKAEPEMAAQMRSNDFTAACADAPRLLEGLKDRIQTTQDNLKTMEADFEASVQEVLTLTRTAMSLLTSATSKKVPAGAPYVGGKPVLKMRSNFAAVSTDAKKQAVQHYLDHLIDAEKVQVPERGADLVAEAVIRVQGGRPLGLQVLRMVFDESHQYVALDKISNSGGEGVVMAMFLYAVMTQLRAETKARLQKLGGGPLILDNPFAKATSPTMWRAQRMLAHTMGLQLIFTTAVQDYNTLGEFSTFVRLRRVAQNSRTGRAHMESSRYRLKEEAPA